MKEKLSALMHDEAFVEKLLALEEPEDVKKLFSDNGVEMTLDEVKAIGKALGELDLESGELTEGDLKDVAGGSSDIAFLILVIASGIILALGSRNKCHKPGVPRCRW